MKKSELQKPIKDIIRKYGFERVKGDDYLVFSKSGNVKLILRIPDGKRGFILGAQFSGFGYFDGVFSHAAMKQYDYAYELAFGIKKDYPESEIIFITEKVCSDYLSYIEYGLDEIKKRIDEWTFGDFDENYRDKTLRFLGLPGIDPYSEEYFNNTLAQMSNGGFISIPKEEYLEHKDYYDKFADYGGTISVDNKKEMTNISFSGIRKWYQQ